MKTDTPGALIAIILAATWLAKIGALQAESTATPTAAPTPGASAPTADGTASDANPPEHLQMNFRNAPVDLVLDHLSAAGHLIIHKETDPRGVIDVESKDPLSLDEAIELLNSALRKNGCAVTRDGRILTVVSLDSAKSSDLEVVTGSDPNSVEKSDRVVTQIIPVRYVTAGQLLNNLQTLLPSSASLSVNESANSLILVATKTQIRRMLRIVSAIDTSMARVSSIKIIPLRYADAKQLATVIQQLFSSQGSPQSGGAGGGPFNFGGGGGPPGFGGSFGAFANSETAASSSSASKVVAVADEQSNSLILSAASDRLATLVGMVHEIDQPVADIRELRVFNLRNADPTELANQLAQLFPDSSNRNSDPNQPVVLFGGGPPGPGGGFGGGPGGPFGAGGAVDGTGTNTRSQKKTQVIAVPDPRTSSLLVSAASALMPQIAQMIQQLDASAARKEIVQVYELRNADPQDITQVLQDLFNRNSTTRNNNNNGRSSLLGQSNPLTTRETEQQSGTTTATSGLANSSSRGGGAGTGAGSGF